MNKNGLGAYAYYNETTRFTKFYFVTFKSNITGTLGNIMEHYKLG